MEFAGGSSIDASNTPRVAVVTGATGFIGRHVVAALHEAGWRVRACVRRHPVPPFLEGVECCPMGDLGPDTVWDDALRGAQVVVHCAALAHLSERDTSLVEGEFQRVNVQATKGLAEAAGRHQVRRLVFVSSIGVNGDRTVAKPFSPTDSPNPHGYYAKSKQLAEDAVIASAAESGFEYVIIRPCLVFGAGAPGNVDRLLQLVKRRVPLPFASLSNRRSLISVEALAELLTISCSHPQAAGRVFLAAESPPLSTAEITRALARGLGQAPRVYRCPVTLLRIAAALVGRSYDMRRLCDSLEVDAGLAQTLLSWRPSINLIDRIVAVAATSR